MLDEVLFRYQIGIKARIIIIIILIVAIKPFLKSTSFLERYIKLRIFSQEAFVIALNHRRKLLAIFFHACLHVALLFSLLGSWRHSERIRISFPLLRLLDV